MQRLERVSAAIFRNAEILVEMYVVNEINFCNHFKLLSILKWFVQLYRLFDKLSTRFEGATAHPKHGEEGRGLNQRSKEEKEKSCHSKFTSSVQNQKNGRDHRDGRSSKKVIAPGIGPGSRSVKVVHFYCSKIKKGIILWTIPFIIY